MEKPGFLLSENSMSSRADKHVKQKSAINVSYSMETERKEPRLNLEKS